MTSDRRALRFALFTAWGLVLARSAVYLVYEQSFFDSDQAIVGLMAKHLIEGRAFPLFYYGQTYILAVDAWIAAPFLLVLGPTVFALHLSVIFTNLVAASLLVTGLVRWGGLTPWRAVVATVFFTFAPPVTSASLVEPANMAVFVWVPLLWFVRHRPLWFGVVLAVGVLYREFTVYALPAIAIAEIRRGGRWGTIRWRHWLVAGVAALGVWQGVRALEPYADLMGPGSRGVAIGEGRESEVANIAKRVDVDLAALPGRAVDMFALHMPRVIGTARVDSPLGSQGLLGIGPMVGLGLLACLVWAVWRARAVGFATAAFSWFLVAVGLLSAVVYVITRPAGPAVDRYLLLTILAPIGVVALALRSVTGRAGAWAVGAVVAVWCVASLADHVVLARRFWPEPPVDQVRVAVDALERQGVTVAEAGYWRAYKLSFLSEERLVVAATEVERILEYRRRADRLGAALLSIDERPCPTGPVVPVGPWFLCRARP